MPHEHARQQVASRSAALVFVLLSVAHVCVGQDQPVQNCSLRLLKGGVPAVGRLSDRINRYPVFSVEVSQNGHVAKVGVVKGTGSATLDAKLKKGLSRWRYNAQPNCPPRVTTATVTIDF